MISPAGQVDWSQARPSGSAPGFTRNPLPLQSHSTPPLETGLQFAIGSHILSPMIFVPQYPGLTAVKGDAEALSGGWNVELTMPSGVFMALLERSVRLCAVQPRITTSADSDGTFSSFPTPSAAVGGTPQSNQSPAGQLLGTSQMPFPMAASAIIWQGSNNDECVNVLERNRSDPPSATSQNGTGYE
jgi:hypothetical protein